MLTKASDPKSCLRLKFDVVCRSPSRALACLLSLTSIAHAHMCFSVGVGAGAGVVCRSCMSVLYVGVAAAEMAISPFGVLCVHSMSVSKWIHLNHGDAGEAAFAVMLVALSLQPCCVLCVACCVLCVACCVLRCVLCVACCVLRAVCCAV